MVNPPLWSGGGRREPTCGILPISLKGISNMFLFPFLITQQLILNWTAGVMTAQLRNTEILDWTFLWHETHFWDSLRSSLCCGFLCGGVRHQQGPLDPWNQIGLRWIQIGFRLDSDCLHSHICFKVRDEAYDPALLSLTSTWSFTVHFEVTANANSIFSWIQMLKDGITRNGKKHGAWRLGLGWLICIHSSSQTTKGVGEYPEVVGPRRLGKSTLH